MSDISSIVNKYKSEINRIIAVNQSALKAEIVKKVNEAHKNPNETINAKMDQMKDEITAAIKSSLPKF